MPAPRLPNKLRHGVPLSGTLAAAAGALLYLTLSAAASGAPVLVKPAKPLSGMYQMSALRICGSGQAPALFRAETAQVSFTQSHNAFTEWVEEITSAESPAGAPPGWQPDSTTLQNTANPGAPDSLLAETAVEWGRMDIANFRSEIAAPGNAITNTVKTGPTWFLVTEYSFGEETALDTFTAGHAVYVWKDELDGWLRYIVNLNSKLAFTSAAVSAHAAFQQDFNGVAYNCLRQLQLHQ